MLDVSEVKEALTLEALESYAQALSKTLAPGSVICLIGPLGAGKTTFSQFLCKALGVEEYVTSPTFNLMNVYDADRGLNIYHFDAYRLSEPDEIGMDDYLYGKGISIVEWADLIAEWIPKGAIWIALEPDGEFCRKLTVGDSLEEVGGSHEDDRH